MGDKEAIEEEENRLKDNDKGGGNQRIGVEEEMANKNQEIEKLEEEKRKLAEKDRADQAKIEALSVEKEKIDKIAAEGTKTTEELIEAYSRRDEQQKAVEDERSKKSLLTNELSQKIRSIKETKGNDDPEIKELEARLKNLQEEAVVDEERQREVDDKKAKLEQLLEDHIESLSSINDRRNDLEEEIEELKSLRKKRAEEKQKILARLAELRNGEQAGNTGGGTNRPTFQELYPYNSSVAVELKELGSKAMVVSQAMRKLKQEISAYLQKDRLSEDDVRRMPGKQNELMSRLVELDEITKRVQYLMGLVVTPSEELGLPRKYRFMSGLGETPAARTLSQLRPEQILPQVIVCGPDLDHPQIVVCETKPASVGTMQNGCFSPTNVRGRPSSSPLPASIQSNNAGLRANFCGQSLQGDGVVMSMGFPYMPLSNQNMFDPFRQSQMAAPISPWMMSPGLNYRTPTMMWPMASPEQLMHARILQSVTSPCPCINPVKKHKKCKRRKPLPQQALPVVYSCPNLVKGDWRYNWN